MCRSSTCYTADFFLFFASFLCCHSDEMETHNTLTAGIAQGQTYLKMTGVDAASSAKRGEVILEGVGRFFADFLKSYSILSVCRPWQATADCFHWTISAGRVFFCFAGISRLHVRCWYTFTGCWKWIKILQQFCKLHEKEKMKFCKVLQEDTARWLEDGVFSKVVESLTAYMGGSQCANYF